MIAMSRALIERSGIGAARPCLPVSPPHARAWFDSRECAELAELAAMDWRAALERLFAFDPAHHLRRVRGRETFFWPTESGGFVVKRFRGFDPRDWWYECLRGREPRSPGRREALIANELVAAGLPAPRAVGFVDEPAASRRFAFARGQSAVILERVAHSIDARTALSLATPREVDRMLDELVEVVARLHRAGFYHRDLYFQHLVLADEPRAGSRWVMLDVGRARRERSPRERWFVKDLAQLAHSRPANVGDARWRRFVARYLELGSLDGDVQRWCDAIERKCARLAAHRPKWVDPDGGRPSRA
jgi:tRNA A-37 threonylcarbamoyl transferase component Bud32